MKRMTQYTKTADQPVCRMIMPAQGIHQRSTDCLILTSEASTGEQIAALGSAFGWRPHLVHSDKQAYEYLLHRHADIAIADIDAIRLGGLAVLTYCHHQTPSIATYAISPAEHPYRQHLARNLGGCDGFFYLRDGRPDIDSSRGMAAQLAHTTWRQ